jgi:hypothetical protein
MYLDRCIYIEVNKNRAFIFGKQQMTIFSKDSYKKLKGQYKRIALCIYFQKYP